MIGYGSIGKGLLPLLEKHLAFAPDQLCIIDPLTITKIATELSQYQVVTEAVTQENCYALLKEHIKIGTTALIINVAVDVDSATLIKTAQQLNSLYIDTATEAWPGFYIDDNLSLSERSNYMMRERVLALKETCPQGMTAISCCGANPGMVSWFVKKALLNLRDDINPSLPEPITQKEWAVLMHELGVKGVHVAERDMQETSYTRPVGTFANTWSVPGCISECIQAAELGWGTHEKKFPENGNEHTTGNKAAIYLDSRGGETVVKSWVPTGPQEAFLITHNEAISIADYFSLHDETNEALLFRPTVHYAYRPSKVTVDSIHELMETGSSHTMLSRIITEDEITGGSDYLGVLLYGHERNAYWFGSKLTIEEARALAPRQNATGLQVTSALIAAIVWAIDNQKAGIIEADQLDYKQCLAVQAPYLGTLEGHYTDWSPGEGVAASDRWQFYNVVVDKKTVS